MSINGVVIEPHDHVVNIYGEDRHLVDDVSHFVAAGLAGDGAVVVVATKNHTDSLARELASRIDLQAAIDAGRYRCMDAAEMLSKFMLNGSPNPAKFSEVIGGLIAEAGSGGRPVRVFGEMVALLWADGDVAGAIKLEALWNSLSRDHDFFLYCAYPLDGLTGDDDLVGMHDVCSHHSSVIAPRSYTPRTSTEEAFALGEDPMELYVPTPTAVSAARRFVQATLVSWGEEAIIGDASIVVSELAANAVMHAGSPFRVSVTRENTKVRIAVDDLSADPPQLRQPDGSAGGRGLILVAALSSQWSAESGPHGKRVWAEIPCASSQRSSR